MYYWDPYTDIFIIPGLNWPIRWYGFLFALGFIIAFPIFKDILFRYLRQHAHFSQEDAKQKALKITDHITFYVVIATIVGAKLGHYLFYEQPSQYLNDPLEMLLSREGLASHGAALAIVFALWVFSYWSKKIEKDLTWVRLMDFIAIPTALVAVFIRIGNFFNQEILGTPTTLPWGVVFGHPADGSLPIPRHPVQLYEALVYLLVFFLLWRWTFHPKYFLTKGWLIGWFFLLVFGFRFLIEYLKLEQSHLFFSSSEITMGQWLSLPFLLLGAFIILLSYKK